MKIPYIRGVYRVVRFVLNDASMSAWRFLTMHRQGLSADNVGLASQGIYYENDNTVTR